MKAWFGAPLALPLVLVLAFAADAPAQAVGGRNVELGATVVELTRQGDTTTVTYVLTIEPTSAEALAAFTVESPSVVEVVSPMPPRDWTVAREHRGYAVAHWAVFSAARVAAGSESPPLTFRAIGVPGIVNARVTGHYEKVHGDADAPEDEDSFLAHSSVMRVVGVVVPRDGSARGHTERALAELEEACALGWLRADGTCDTLRADLTGVLEAIGAGAGRVTAATDVLIARLDGARGRSIGESAYQLFRVTAELIADAAR